jgi:hypothetical protein
MSSLELTTSDKENSFGFFHTFIKPQICRHKISTKLDRFPPVEPQTLPTQNLNKIESKLNAWSSSSIHLPVN